MSEKLSPYQRKGDAPIGRLPDGTPLYPAYRPYVIQGERSRRSLSSWGGSMGETVATTPDGRLYRKERLWWNDPDAQWRKIKIAY